MSNTCSFRCKHCNQQFSQKAVYQEATVILCPLCSKMFIPSLWHYLRKEWIEPISVAIVLALFIKRVFFEIYVIPTSSMEPTLHGGGNYPEDGGDKVLVNKFVYHFTEPKSWDVIVFDPPKSNHLFIKRLIGLPNQTIQIVDGDIYVDGKILRKPPAVEESMLYCLYDSTEEESHLNHFTDFAKEPPWKITENWRVSENNFAINKASGILKFAYPIDMRIESHKNTNLQIKNGLFESYERKKARSNQHFDDEYKNLKVGDICVKGKLKINELAGVWQLVIFENEDVFKLLVDVKEKKAEVYQNAEKVWSSSLDINTSGEYEYSFSNVDDKLSGKIANAVFNYTYVNEKLVIDTQKNGFEFVADDCNLEMSDIKVSRDVNYLLGDNNDSDKEKVQGSTSENSYPTYKTGVDDFFCLGDNVLDSQDSRVWGFAKGNKIKGQAMFVLMPLRIWFGKELPPQLPFLTHRTRFKKIN
jgi:signal peptidase I